MRNITKVLLGIFAAAAALLIAAVVTPPFHSPSVPVDYFWGVVRLAAPVLAGICVPRIFVRSRSGNDPPVEPVISPLRSVAVEPQQMTVDVTALSYDELLPQAAELIFECGQATTSMLQRRLKLGYTRASALVDQLEAAGLISPFDGAAPRKVLLDRSGWEARLAQLPPLTSRDHPAADPALDPALDPVPDFVPDPVPYLDDESEWRREQTGLSRVDYALAQVDGMEGHRFEEWCAGLLMRHGFDQAVVTRASGDQGVDVVATKDGVSYAIQCKCYARDLDNTPIQEVSAGKLFYHCHVGAVMTNRYFTAGAKELAKATGTLLWDRDHLRALISQDYQDDNGSAPNA